MRRVSCFRDGVATDDTKPRTFDVRGFVGRFVSACWWLPPELDYVVCGCSSVGRASVSQTEGREFETRRPLNLIRDWYSRLGCW